MALVVVHLTGLEIIYVVVDSVFELTTSQWS